ncbi:Protein LURP-one-related 8, partial [Ananas comosus]
MTKVHPNAAAPETKIPTVSGDGAAVALTVWRRSLLFNGKGFTVFDAKGNLVFRVDDYASGSRGEVVLMDAAGNPLLTIRRKKLSLSERWIVYKGEEVGGEPLFSVRKHVTLLPSPALAHVTGGYAVEGSYARRSVAVYDAARRPIAAVEAKGAAVGPDVFRLVVAPAFDAAAAMAIVILLDRMFAPRRSLILP